MRDFCEGSGVAHHTPMDQPERVARIAISQPETHWHASCVESRVINGGNNSGIKVRLSKTLLLASQSPSQVGETFDRELKG